MKPKITPAALGALAEGHLKNFVIAATPGGIETQEKDGQIEQSFAETLPIDGTEPGRGREQFEALGFVFSAPADDLFVNVQFPPGWRKKPAEHSMWTMLVDADGKDRAFIFYKAAFYDRRAFIRPA